VVVEPPPDEFDRPLQAQVEQVAVVFAGPLANPCARGGEFCGEVRIRVVLTLFEQDEPKITSLSREKIE
jgi:hypothetical protein